MVVCCVVGCSAETGTDSAIKFFKFPKCKVAKKRWLQAVPTREKVHCNTLICSSHFLDSDYNSKKIVERRLKKDAVPSVFENVAKLHHASDESKSNSDASESGDSLHSEVQVYGSTIVNMADLPNNEDCMTAVGLEAGLNGAGLKDTGDSLSNGLPIDTEMFTDPLETSNAAVSENGDSSQDSQSVLHSITINSSIDLLETVAESSNITNDEEHKKSERAHNTSISKDSTAEAENTRSEHTPRYSQAEPVQLLTEAIESIEKILDHKNDAPETNCSIEPKNATLERKVSSSEHKTSTSDCEMTTSESKDSMSEANSSKLKADQDVVHSNSSRERDKNTSVNETKGEAIDVNRDTQDSAAPDIVLSCETGETRAESPSDCMMIVENVEVTLDPDMFYSDDGEGLETSSDDGDVQLVDTKPAEPVSLLTSSDEDDVILEEPVIDTVEVSDETDEDDMPLKKLCTKRIPDSVLEKKVRDIFWGLKEYFCYRCKYLTQSGQDYAKHAATHVNEANVVYYCHVCSFQTSSKGQFTRHKKKHRDDKRYTCHLCDYRARHKMSLVYHMKSHEKDDAFTCKHCSYTTDNRDVMLKHKEMHDTPKIRYTCVRCGFFSAEDGVLQKHRCAKPPPLDDKVDRKKRKRKRSDDEYVPGKEV